MANDSAEIQYNDDFQDLEKLLSKVKRAGGFFAHGTMEIPMPKVEIENVGVLSFPVPASQIAALIQSAARAPYGRGEDTIVDESVRKVWQLPPDKARISGKSWAQSFDHILRQAVAGLGCEGMEVSAEFYKLLVYDTGGFFLPHRDTEKTGGMFATLVIGLPSQHRGGLLVLRHGGREATVDMSGAEFSEVSFAAFYADCEHEVRPVTEGNRVCLIYNLVRRPGRKGADQPLGAPDYESQIADAAPLLQQKLSAADAPAKIVWLLEHQYSPEGLSFAGLKSADAAKVKVLVEAARRANCAAHLGIVHIEESGAAQETYSDYHSRNRRYRHEDDEDDETESSSEDFEVIEVCDWRHYIAQWRGLNDQPADFGEIPLRPGELLPDGALDDEKPDRQRYMEASGNEGASFERSYHRAALVLWPREKYAEVLLQAGVEAAMPFLRERIEACKIKNAPASAQEEALSLARRMIELWEAAPEYAGYGRPKRPEKRDGMLRLLIQLGQASLLEKFISNVVTHDYDGSENGALVSGVKLLDVESAGKLYAELIAEKMPHWHGHCVDLLKALAASPALTKTAAQRKSLLQMAQAAVNGLDKSGNNREEEEEWMSWRETQDSRKVDAALVANLLDVLGELEAGPLRAAAVERFAARPKVFDPVTILTLALGSCRRRDAAISRLWQHCVEFLLRRSGHPPEPPKDWRQDVKLSCACADCRELQAFVLNPAEQSHRFRVRQNRRQHLHQIIERHHLDMTHVTERQGSPQTLVCAKDRRSYKRRCDEYKKDIAALASLESQAKENSSGDEETLKTISAARADAKRWAAG